MPKVLVSDELSETAVQIFRDRGLEVDYLPKLGKDKDALLAAIGQYDGLAIRSATKVSDKVLAAATNLKVIGRAGIGVDNVDIPAASKRGVIVMNTPFGNSVTTAEHAIAMMFAVARQIPEANASTHAGKWEKSKFMGVELFNKTLGVIGAGNIGGIVCDRAVGLHMKVVAYDPFLSDERAKQLGVHKVELGQVDAGVDRVFGTKTFWLATSDDVFAVGIEPDGKALKAGLHVMVEKPISVHRADAERIDDEARFKARFDDEQPLEAFPHKSPILPHASTKQISCQR